MNKQIRWGIILQYLQMGLNILINLIYTPIMIRILGDNEYGIYNLTSSIISYLSLLSLGFGAGYIRYYTKYKKEEDDEKIKKLNGMYLLVFSIMAAVALGAGLLIAFNSSLFFNNSYSASDLETAKILMIFLSVNLAISFPASVFVSHISSQEKFIFSKLVNIGKTIISPCLSIALLYLGYGSIGMVVVTTVVSFVVDVINILFCVCKLKMRFSFGKIEKGLFKDIAVFSVFIAINQIIDQLNWQTDKIILGKMMNGTAVAVYAVASTINNMYIMFSTAISNVFTPRVHSIVSSDSETKDQELTKLFIKVGRLQFFVISLILTGFIFFGKFFISKWAGGAYTEAYYVALILIVSATIPLIQNLGIEIQRAKNLHKFRSVVYLVMAIANIALSIWFCKLWGVIGVSIATAITFILCNVIIMNVYYHKVIGLNMLQFWKSILSTLPAFIAPVVFGVCLMLFYNFRGLLDFALLVCAYAICYAVSVYFLGFNKSEKEYVCAPLRKIFGKFRKKKNDSVEG